MLKQGGPDEKTVRPFSDSSRLWNGLHGRLLRLKRRQKELQRPQGRNERQNPRDGGGGLFDAGPHESDGGERASGIGPVRRQGEKLRPGGRAGRQSERTPRQGDLPFIGRAEKIARPG